MSDQIPQRRKGESKREHAIRVKRWRKATRFARDGVGESRYAKKRRGEIAPELGGPVVWCPCCYRARGKCTCAEAEARAASSAA